MDGRPLTVNQIADAVGISHKQVENILHQELGDVPLVGAIPFDTCSKATRVVMLQANLALFEMNPDSFLDCFLTQDECWVHHFKAETKWQSILLNICHPLPCGEHG